MPILSAETPTVNSTFIIFPWIQNRRDLVDFYQVTYSYQGNCNTSQLCPSQRGGSQRVNEGGNTVTEFENLLPYSPYLIIVTAINSIGSSGTASTTISTAPASKYTLLY